MKIFILCANWREFIINKEVLIGVEKNAVLFALKSYVRMLSFKSENNKRDIEIGMILIEILNYK